MPKEQCYGVIVVYRESTELEEEKYKFLILLHTGLENNWSFPKGHVEDGETPVETALRELKEETGITDVSLIGSAPLFHEEYKIIRNLGEKLKVNDYFIGFVKDKNAKIQPEEIRESAWLTFKEAMNRITYKERRSVLENAKAFLEEYERRK